MAGLLEILDCFLKRAFGNTKLRPYESACLDAWKEQLSPDAVDILDRQLEWYDFVQRQSADKLVCFYRLGDPTCKQLPAEARFPFQTEEAAVARVRLRSVGGRGRALLRADLVVVNGRFFDIEFDRRPRTVFPKGVTREQIEVTDVKILADLMSAGRATTPFMDTGGLEGWLREWAETWGLQGLRVPLAASVRDEILRNLDTKLPPDYLDLIAQTAGLTIQHCEIHGLSEIRTLVWPDESFYILADIEGRGAVGVRQGDTEGTLYYIDNEADEAQAVGPSLRAVIERELELATTEEGAAG